MTSNSHTARPTAPGNSLGVIKGNVKLLLIGCNRTNCQDGMNECIKFVKRDLDIHNCISYLTLAVEEKIESLASLLVSYIWDHMHTVKGTPKFLKLGADDIRVLVPKPDVQLPWNKRDYPTEILGGIYGWLRENVNDRLEHFVDISTKFPLKLVNSGVLKEIYRKDPDLKEKETCIKLYINIIEGKLFEARQRRQSDSLAADSAARAEVRRIASRDTDRTDSSTTKEGSHDLTSAPLPSQSSSQLEEEHLQVNSMDVEEEDLQGNSMEVGEEGVQGKSIDVEEEGLNGNSSDIEEEDLQENSDVSEENEPLRKDISSETSSRKRVAQIEDDEVEFLEIVPVKKNVTAEIDFTTDKPTEAKAKLYFVNGTAQRQLYSMSLPDFTLEVVADFPLQDQFKCIFIMVASGLVVVVCSDQKGAQTIRKLDLKTKEWVKSTPMVTHWRNAAWAVVNGFIYVTGGIYKNGKLRQSMEHFPVTRPLTWEKEEIPERTSSHAMAVIRGKIFMVGGVKQKVRKLCSSSVHSFDPWTKKWERNKEMLVRRAGLCLAVVHTKLYAIGGSRRRATSGEMERTCEVYDANTRNWTSIAPLNQSRRDASAFVFEDKIYVVGGNRGSPTMEFYDAQNNTWTLVTNCKLPSYGQYNAVALAYD